MVILGGVDTKLHNFKLPSQEIKSRKLTLTVLCMPLYSNSGWGMEEEMDGGLGGH